MIHVLCDLLIVYCEIWPNNCHKIVLAPNCPTTVTKGPHFSEAPWWACDEELWLHFSVDLLSSVGLWTHQLWGQSLFSLKFDFTWQLKGDTVMSPHLIVYLHGTHGCWMLLLFMVLLLHDNVHRSCPLVDSWRTWVILFDGETHPIEQIV